MTFKAGSGIFSSCYMQHVVKFHRVYKDEFARNLHDIIESGVKKAFKCSEHELWKISDETQNLFIKILIENLPGGFRLSVGRCWGGEGVLYEDLSEGPNLKEVSKIKLWSNSTLIQLNPVILSQLDFYCYS